MFPTFHPPVCHSSLYFKGIFVELMGLSTHVTKTLLGFTFHSAGSPSCCCHLLEPQRAAGGRHSVNKVWRVNYYATSKESRETAENQRDSTGNNIYVVKFWFSWGLYGVNIQIPQVFTCCICQRECGSFTQTAFSTWSTCFPSTWECRPSAVQPTNHKACLHSARYQSLLICQQSSPRSGKQFINLLYIL